VTRGSRAAGRAHVHLAVDAATAALTADDLVLAGALTSRGIAVTPVVWGDALPAGATLVLRSVYDYIDDPGRFRRWLDALDAAAVDVHNPTATVRWNMHKGYLHDLAARGVPTVPTTVVAAGSAGADLAAIMRAEGWDDAVVKPAVGATARATVHVGRIGAAAAREHLRALAAVEDALVQPFLASVVERGETSIVAIAGEVTHVVHKRAADGDWRVQAEFGGRSERVPVATSHREVAARVLAVVDPVPLYARVDVVTGTAGELLLLELELVEPELFFRLAPDAASRLADALGGRTGAGT
jgi:glutathione synthase/RimK-type ligase-like ATP-grasp enzyme